MTTLKKNFIYNVMHRFLITILPFVVIPYVSRILTAEMIGIYSYTHSIVYYFMMIAMLGINNYGNRTIAKVRDNKEELSKNFLGIYYIQLIISILVIICYIGYTFLFVNEYKLVTFVQVIYLASCLFNVEWFFLGLEKFNITSITGIGLKLLSILSIFLFVKGPDDLWIYTMILSICALLERLILFFFLKKEITFFKIKFQDVKRHLKPCLVLFIPVISVGVYKQMDKVMLGILGNVTEVGYYEQAEKIISAPMSIVITLGAVMLPKISNLVVKNNLDLIMSYIYKTIQLTMFLMFPICFGLIAVSSDFIFLFLGDSFAKTATLINILSFSTLFISFASIIRRQYLLPFEKDGIFVKSVIIGAISNFIINLILIPKYLSIGACIGTLIAEFLVMLIQMVYASRKLPVLQYVCSILSFLFKTIIMFIVVIIIKNCGFNPFITVILQVIFGVLIYLLLNLNYLRTILSLKTN